MDFSLSIMFYSHTADVWPAEEIIAAGQTNNILDKLMDYVDGCRNFPLLRYPLGQPSALNK